MTLDSIHNMQQLIEAAAGRGTAISEIVLEYEAENSQKSPEDVLEKMQANWLIMKQSVREGMTKEEGTMGGLVKGAASAVQEAIAEGRIPEDRLSKTVLRALAVAEVNASMGLIVAYCRLLWDSPGSAAYRPGAGALSGRKSGQGLVYCCRHRNGHR